MRITLYRLKSAAPFGKDSLRENSGYREVSINTIGTLTCKLFVKSGGANQANWAKELAQLATSDDLAELRVQSSAAVLLAKRGSVIYAVAFGGGFQALDPSRIERGFGVRVTANAIAGTKIKSVDTRGLNREGRSQKVIVPVAGALGALGVDPTEEWIRQLSGTATSTDFATTAAGSDSLRLSIKGFTLSELPTKLAQIEKYWKSAAYKREFGFLDNFSQISSRDPIVAQLDDEVAQLVLGNNSDVFFAAPDPFEQLQVDSFELIYRKRVPFEELTQEELYEALSKLNVPTDDPLHKIKIEAKDADGGTIDKAYPIHDYIQAEITKGDSRYVLSAGLWFEVAASYVKEVRDFVTKIEDLTPTLKLPKWPTTSDGKYIDEGQYNKQLVKQRSYELLDAKNLHFGQYDKVEICDVLTPDKEMLCVKRATRSSTLSHLFAQGSVSASLMSEADYQAKLMGAYNNMKNTATWGSPSDWKIVYAIGTTKSGPLAESLFFFSQVNLVTHVKDIRRRNIPVAIARIPQ